MNSRLYISIVAVGLLVASSVAGAGLSPSFLPFQGYLSDASGKTIEDGTRVVQFKIYNAPIGGDTVWAGEVHRLSVNQGLVNTVLGTKTKLDATSFGQTLYLEMTVDVDGNGAITPADPPMLPRQIILPAIFAIQAEKAVDADTLNGYGWDALLADGASDPSVGKIAGSRIKIGEITGDHIADGAIGTDQLADGSIFGTKISTDSIESRHIGNEVVLPRHRTRLNLKESKIEGAYSVSAAAADPAPVPGLEVEISGSGRPFMIGVTGGRIIHDGGYMVLRLERTEPSGETKSIVEWQADGRDISRTPLSLWTLDADVSSGAYTYRIRAGRAGSGGDRRVVGPKLVVFEL